MQKRFWLSIAMLAAGASMLAAAGLASPGSTGSSQARKGGTLRFVMQLDIENVDPQRSYYVPEWEYEWLTGRMLLNYAHAAGRRGYRLLNDGAQRYKVSRDGRTYTFFIRRGMRFSDGKPITAANYRHALLRILNPGVQSPGASFFTDPNSVNIVGALAYNEGKSRAVSGIRMAGRYRLIIRLQKPSPLLLSLVALPFTMAVPTGFPMETITRVPFGNFKQLPSGGRYYVASRIPNRSLVIKKNRYYKGPTPGRVDSFVYEMGVEANQAFLLIRRNQKDWSADSLAPTVWGPLIRQYGTKTGRVRITPSSCVYYLSLNTAKGPFRGANARKAINYGINRPQFIKIGGAAFGTPTDQILTPAIPGFRNFKIYPNKPNLSRARRLARGTTGSKVNLWHSATAASVQRAQLLQSWLKAMGYNNVELRSIASGYYTQLGRRGTDYDIANAGWCQDFPDPYDYVNKLLSGETIQDAQNNNLSYFNNPTANRLMNRAASLAPPKRYRVYGQLDATIMRRWAPWAPWSVANDRHFFSNRIAPKSIKAHAIYELDLGQMALK